jgi:tRNA U34 5-methylaminomethyl-2-thiouridine-forming methyltransferase MnmC
MKLQLRKTADGSNTLYVPELDEHYHSFHGAIQEANHIFIKNGLLNQKKKSIRLLEVGFGTGLNALLTACEGQKSDYQIDYVGVEAYPVPAELMQKMDYVSLIDDASAGDYFDKIIHSKWSQKTTIHSGFKLTKLEERIKDTLSDKKFDLIYFDAFGPRVQSDMWNIELLEKMFSFLNFNGELVTYCAQGQFKRDLKEVGFEVFSLPGPPGKREMVRARKNK